MKKDPEGGALDDPASEIEELLRDAVAPDEIEDPNLGDVDVAPGEVVAVVDGVEVRHVADESGAVLPVADESGEIIGRTSFPEGELGPDDQGGEP